MDTHLSYTESSYMCPLKHVLYTFRAKHARNILWMRVCDVYHMVASRRDRVVCPEVEHVLEENIWSTICAS